MKTTKALLSALYVLAVGILINTILNNMIYPPQFLTDDAIGVDFRVYYGAARAFIDGGNPYACSATSIIPYPMFSVVLCSWMGYIDEFRALLLWTWIRTGFVLGAYLIIIYGLRPTGAKTETMQFIQRHWTIPACLICASFDCLFWGYPFGNIQPIVFFLTCLFFALALKGKDKTAGCVLAMLCLIKITPVFLVPALFFIRHRGVLTGWTVAMTIYSAVLIVTGWWRWELYLASHILPALGHALVGCSVSVPIYIGQAFFPDVLSNPRLFNLVSKINLVVVFGASIAAYSIAYFRRVNPDWRDIFTTASYTMVLMSPAIEPFHFAYLAPALALLISGYIEGRHSTRYFITSMIYWAAFLAYPTCKTHGIWHGCEFLPLQFYPLACVCALWTLSIIKLCGINRTDSTLQKKIQKNEFNS